MRFLLMRRMYLRVTTEYSTSLSSFDPQNRRPGLIGCDRCSDPACSWSEVCWMMVQSSGSTLRKCTTPIPLSLCDLDSQSSRNESAAVLCRHISYDNVLNDQTTNVSEYTAPFVELVHRKATQDDEE